MVSSFFYVAQVVRYDTDAYSLTIYLEFCLLFLVIIVLSSSLTVQLSASSSMLSKRYIADFMVSASNTHDVRSQSSRENCVV